MKKILSTCLLVFLTHTCLMCQMVEKVEPIHTGEAVLLPSLGSATQSVIKVTLVVRGTSHDLTLIKTELLDEIGKAAMPDIKTFDVIKGGTFAGTCTHTSVGDWYYLFLDGETIAITPDIEKHSGLHFISSGQHHIHEGCSVGPESINQLIAQRPNNRGGQREVMSQWGEKIRTFRMAIVTTGEFYELNGANDGQVNAVIMFSINSLTALYMKELSVRFTLVGAPRVYKDSATDPFDPANGGRPEQAGRVVDMNFGVNTYDIGHALHKSNSSIDDGWGSGGVALRPAICENFAQDGAPIKAQGWSGSFSNSGFSWISLFAHEIGHMFSANHTFNGTGESCTTAISPINAYEIGSGNTIMSYNGICNPDQNMPADGANDNYFHIASLREMVSEILERTGCPTETNSNNSIPIVEASPCGASFTVPKGTPFFLRGSGSDTDGDQLTYTWEQYNEDGAGSPTQGDIGGDAASDNRAPIFRSYPPTPSTERYFPRKDFVRNGVIDPFDVLSVVGRTVKMILTVRDNDSNGGAIAYDSVNVVVSNNGPFVVSNQSTPWLAGNNVNINWVTSNTNALCAKVKIELSIDDGETYPYTIATDVNYATGTLAFQVSGLYPATTMARLRITCIDLECFQFYNISSRFSIQSNCAAPTSVLCPAVDGEFDAGAPALNMTTQSYIVGQKLGAVTKNINDGDPIIPFVIYNLAGTGCQFMNTGTRGQFELFKVDVSGTYTFSIDQSGSGAAYLTLFDNATYNSTNPCSSFISSSAITASTGGFFPSNTFTAQLTACKEYRLHFMNASRPNPSTLLSITGPGIAVKESTNADPNFSYAYMAVNKATNVIVSVSDDPDFRTLPGGVFTIYGVSIKSGGTTPPNITDLNAYIGRQFNQFYQTGDCFLSSINSFDLTINSNCSITAVSLGNTGTCNPNDNTFSQEVIVTFATAPTTGKIEAFGQQFNITSSPQSIILSLPSNGGLSSGDLFFTAESDCRFPLNISQPDNCCPFDITLPTTSVLCEGSSVVLSTIMVPGAAYEWYGPSGLISTATGPNIDVTTGGLYTVIVTSATGCMKDGMTTVSVLSKPTLEVVAPPVLCDGDQLNLIVESGADSIEVSRSGIVISLGTNLFVPITQGGTYIVKAFNDRRCIAEEMVNVQSGIKPVVNLGLDVFKCEGDAPPNLDATTAGNVTYSWFRNGVVLASTASTLNPATNGTYTVAVTTSQGCVGRDTVAVNYEGVPSLSIPEELTLCDGNPTILQAMTNANRVRWYVDGILAQDGPAKVFAIDKAAIVTVIVGNSDNCTLEDTTIVQSIPSPKPDLGDDINLCSGQDTVLVANAIGVTTMWYRNDVLIASDVPTLNVSTPGIYRVDVTNEQDCTGRSAVEVKIFSLPETSLGQDFSLCSGNLDTITANNINVASTKWFRNGVLISGGIDELIISQGGTYRIEASNAANCIVTDEIIVVERPLPTVELGANRIACEGDTVILVGPVGLNYRWFSGATQISTAKDISVTTDASFTLRVTDSFGCSNVDNVTVNFDTKPTLNLNQTNFEFCKGLSARITVNTNADSITWKFNNTVVAIDSLGFTARDSGVYVVTVFSQGGCKVERQANVKINPLPDPAISGPTNGGCQGDSLTFSAITAATYEWKLNGAVVGSTKNLRISQPGRLSLKVTSSKQCVDTSSVNVTFTPKPTLVLSGGDRFCMGDSITLTVASNAASFRWFKDNSSINGATAPGLRVKQGGTYRIEAIGVGDCKAVDSVKITELPSPIINLGRDTSLCPGQSITLNASNNGATYKWSDGSTARTLTVQHPNGTSISTQSYTVSVTNTSNCTTSDVLSVAFQPIIIANIDATSQGVCEGDSIVLTAIGGQQYKWSGPAGTFSILQPDAIVVFPDVPTIYRVEASDACPNNRDTAEIVVDVFTPKAVSAGNDTCVLIGRTLRLNATGGKSYTWADDPSFMSSRNISDPIVSPTIETFYRVTITDSNGCVQEDDIRVCVITDPLSIFKAVTAITPNGDGANDYLVFPGLEAIDDSRITVFNRWGNVVFEKKNYQQDGQYFDGTRGGDMLPADTYYYILTFDKFTIKETLTIVRN